MSSRTHTLRYRYLAASDEPTNSDDVAAACVDRAMRAYRSLVRCPADTFDGVIDKLLTTRAELAETNPDFESSAEGRAVAMLDSAVEDLRALNRTAIFAKHRAAFAA